METRPVRLQDGRVQEAFAGWYLLLSFCCLEQTSESRTGCAQLDKFCLMQNSLKQTHCASQHKRAK